MFCYKDMTFCAVSSKCRNSSGCWRVLTKEEKAKVKKLGFPVAYSDSFECFVPKVKIKKGGQCDS